jgi:hypothetical protein
LTSNYASQGARPERGQGGKESVAPTWLEVAKLLSGGGRVQPSNFCKIEKFIYRIP